MKTMHLPPTNAPRQQALFILPHLRLPPPPSTKLFYHARTSISRRHPAAHRPRSTTTAQALPNSPPLQPDACPPRPPAPASNPPPTAIIVGGGAAGFFTAITLARALRNASGHAAELNARVIVLEASPRVLQKVRVSGGGRCNVTSARHGGDVQSFADNYPPSRGRRELLGPLCAWSAEDTVAWFEGEGVGLKVEPSGKVFPVSDSSSTVIEALVAAARRAGVKVETRTKVTDIGLGCAAEQGISLEKVTDDTEQSGVDTPALTHHRGGRFTVKVHGETVHRKCDCLCICTGSSRLAFQWAAAFGHTIVPPVPSLFTFKISNDTRIAGLAGLSIPDARVRLDVSIGNDMEESLLANGKSSSNARQTEDKRGKWARRKRQASGDNVHEQRGPVLITHWGLSGPAIIQLSSLAARTLNERKYCAKCVVDFMPGVTLEDKQEILQQARTRLAQKTVQSVCPFRVGPIPNRLWRSLAAFSGCSATLRWADMTNALIRKLATVLHQSSLDVSGMGEFKEEFVTAGGVETSEISLKSFQSKVVPGLFFTGEVLNIDGLTGGFNFQNCWSGGFVAGNSMARYMFHSALRAD